MKQNISRQQWAEIDLTEMQLELEIYREKISVMTPPNYFWTIGQLIEFLGDDLFNIFHTEIKNGNISWLIPLDKTVFIREELIDALWEAVKYKLRKEDGIKN